jgi:hypothetical protein
MFRGEPTISVYFFPLIDPDLSFVLAYNDNKTAGEPMSIMIFMRATDRDSVFIPVDDLYKLIDLEHFNVTVMPMTAGGTPLVINELEFVESQFGFPFILAQANLTNADVYKIQVVYNNEFTIQCYNCFQEVNAKGDIQIEHM